MGDIDIWDDIKSKLTVINIIFICILAVEKKKLYVSWLHC